VTEVAGRDLLYNGCLPSKTPLRDGLCMTTVRAGDVMGLWLIGGCSQGIAQATRSGDREHDLALDMAAGGSFVRPSSISKRKRAVYGDANRARIEQTPEFRELLAV
jgi:hypothetical protein